MRKILIGVMILLTVSACKPDSLEVELYTSDVRSARSDGEIIEVPVTVSFSLLGEDKEGMLPKAKAVATDYLSTDSEIVQSKGDMGERLVVETRIPMGTSKKIDAFLGDNARVAALIASDEGWVELATTGYLESLNEELSDINMMLDVDFPADETTFRVVSDSDETVEVFATAVFVSNKPHVNFSSTVDRRDSVEVVFSGEDGSIYQGINPYLFVEWKEE